jgi:hypothetical protein
MCSEGGERGNWTSGEVFDEINSLLSCLAGEDLNSLPAESMGDDQIALQRIGNRVQAEGLRRLRRFDSGQGYAPSGARSPSLAALAVEPDGYNGLGAGRDVAAAARTTKNGACPR